MADKDAAVGCAVLHQDGDGNPILCPGYPHTKKLDPDSRIGITVRYLKTDGTSWDLDIEKVLITTQESKGQFVKAAKDYLQEIHGTGGTFEVIDYNPSFRDDPNRVLTYDAEKDVFLLKLDRERLRTVREAVAEVASRHMTRWKGRQGAVMSSAFSWMDEFYVLPHSDGSGDIAVSHWENNEPCPDKWEHRLSGNTLGQIRRIAWEHYGKCDTVEEMKTPSQ